MSKICVVFYKRNFKNIDIFSKNPQENKHHISNFKRNFRNINKIYKHKYTHQYLQFNFNFSFNFCF